MGRVLNAFDTHDDNACRVQTKPQTKIKITLPPWLKETLTSSTGILRLLLFRLLYVVGGRRCPLLLCEAIPPCEDTQKRSNNLGKKHMTYWTTAIDGEKHTERHYAHISTSTEGHPMGANDYNECD